jgi:hypothetical protein
MSDTETTAKVIDINTAKAIEPGAPKPRRKSGKRSRKKKAIQWLVDCDEGLADLKGLPGAITVDYVGDKAWTATFDPDDEAIDNAVIPVDTFDLHLHGGDEFFVLTSEDGDRWVFAVLSDPHEAEAAN